MSKNKKKHRILVKYLKLILKFYLRQVKIKGHQVILSTRNYFKTSAHLTQQ
jgi:hypothetical protein